MATTALDGAFAALAAAVAAERDAAGMLAYRLATVRLLLEAGEPQLLTEGLAELELAAAGLEAAGGRRRQASRVLAGTLGIAPDTATLPGLAAQAPARWAPTLVRERDALQELVARIRREAQEHGDRAQRALEHVRRRLGTSPERDRRVAPLPHPGERELVADLDLAALVTELRAREITYEGLVDVTTSLLPPDLPDFVSGLPSPA